MNTFTPHAASMPVRLPASASLLPSLLLLSVLAAAPLSVRAAGETRAAQAACGMQPSDPVAASPGSLVRALYTIVSGPAGSAKDWARLERLHAPGALITPTQHGNAIAFAAAPQSLARFIGLNVRLFAQRGFYERETFQRVQRFGHVAHVWSGYETREHPQGPVEGRGINSFQLLHDGQRWCVLSATWDTDTPDHPLGASDAPEGFNQAPGFGYTPTTGSVRFMPAVGLLGLDRPAPHPMEQV